MPACATRRACPGAQVRSWTEADRADQWPVFAPHVAQPAKAGSDEAGGGVAGHGPDDADCCPEASGASWVVAHRTESRGPPVAPVEPDGRGASCAAAGAADLDKGP